MDTIDRRIVDALRKDGRASFAELARTVGLSSSAVHERVGKLEATGVISGYRALVSPAELNLGVTALIGIEPSETGDDDAIGQALAKMGEVEDCLLVAGVEAFVVKVRTSSIEQLYLLVGRLRAIEGVARTRTTVVMRTLFEARSVPGETSQ